jgi:hypothetical protein
MTAIIILNIVFATFVVGGILAILNRGILRDRELSRPVLRVATVPRPAAPRPTRRPSAAGGALQQVVEIR